MVDYIPSLEDKEIKEQQDNWTSLLLGSLKKEVTTWEKDEGMIILEERINLEKEFENISKNLNGLNLESNIEEWNNFYLNLSESYISTKNMDINKENSKLLQTLLKRIDSRIPFYVETIKSYDEAAANEFKKNRDEIRNILLRSEKNNRDFFEFNKKK